MTASDVVGRLSSRAPKRFYGAWTGGFSAGFNNSVGTKDGWQPAEFSSRRSRRLDPEDTEGTRPAQRAEDYMDSEDMADQVSATLRTHSAFRQQYNTSSAEAEIASLIAPSAEYIGSKLLRKGGWRQETAGPPMPELDVVRSGDNDRPYGLGFDPSNETQDEALLRQGKAALRHATTAQPGSLGGRLGFGMFEADDGSGVYGGDGLDYDTELLVTGRSRNRHGKGIGLTDGTRGLLDFAKGSSHTRVVRKHYAPPAVPPEWLPHHFFTPEEDSFRSAAGVHSVNLSAKLGLNDGLGPLRVALAQRFVLGQQQELLEGHSFTRAVLYVPVPPGSAPGTQVAVADDAGDAAKLRQFGGRTRRTAEWVPDPLLCRRFGVEEPVVGTNLPYEPLGSQQEQEAEPEPEILLEPVIERADMDLFKSIFGEEDSFTETQVAGPELPPEFHPQPKELSDSETVQFVDSALSKKEREPKEKKKRRR
eukprot:TRINITY_DN4624_c0_g1_i1.p1 TRINITY_DN4624_c0_g1~~TRINITY_DN4624_c0_g1_i1.p1  ORF type:complete len:488 (-),score=63.69 TRINITY_DN4624_c0_g1_i1:7-1437(-)